MKKLTIICTLLAAISMSAPAMAHYGGGYHHNHGGNIGNIIGDIIDAGLKHKCVATNFRGARYKAVARNRHRAKRRAMRKCRYDSFRPRSCYIVKCKRTFRF